MKKLVTAIISAAVLIFCVFGFSACNGNDAENAVKLVPVESNSVGLMPDIDYYVLPEPAASTKVKALEKLNFVGDLQALYGGQNGYPQAVVVAKNALLGTQVLQDVVEELKNSSNWLLNDTTNIETIVDAIVSHLTDGLEPSVKTQNLTKSAIKNCSINFVPAVDCKSEILSFMEKFNSVSQTSFGVPAEYFFWNGSVGVEQTSKKVSIYAPDGAPALGLAKMMAENVIENVSYEIVNANTVQALVAGANPKADICVLPVNAAVKILGNGNAYKLIGTLTHGNLYIVSENEGQITAENLSVLKGKTVGVVNLASVPGLTFKLILKNNGIEYIEN